nr:unknown [Zea mays]
MTANFVLPLSKDMPHSKEPFDEVIFTELSRDEAQRTLDDMQRVLPRNVTPSYGNSGNQKHVMVPLLLFLKQCLVCFMSSWIRLV